MLLTHFSIDVRKIFLNFLDQFVIVIKKLVQCWFQSFFLFSLLKQFLLKKKKGGGSKGWKSPFFGTINAFKWGYMLEHPLYPGFGPPLFFKVAWSPCNIKGKIKLMKNHSSFKISLLNLKFTKIFFFLYRKCSMNSASYHYINKSPLVVLN